MRQVKLASTVLVLLCFLLMAGCSGIFGPTIPTESKTFATMTPKEKVTFFMVNYNRIYDNTMTMATNPNATPGQKDIVKKKKAVLAQVWPLIKYYDWQVSQGQIPPPTAEQEILNLIDQLMTLAF